MNKLKVAVITLGVVTTTITLVLVVLYLAIRIITYPNPEVSPQPTSRPEVLQLFDACMGLCTTGEVTYNRMDCLKACAGSVCKNTGVNSRYSI